MKELSVFIDESGDFGEYDYHSPFYIITMVFHDQDEDIKPAVEKLNRELSYLDFDDLCIHTGPIIRKEEIYVNMSIEERRRIFNKMVAFFRQVNIRYKCFYIEKKHMEDVVMETGRLSKLISGFIRDHYEEFLSFDDVKIYYDNGQVELTKIITSVFSSVLNSVEFRKIRTSEYNLAQIADLICTVELTARKMKTGFAESEIEFFGTKERFKKNILKYIRRKKL